MESLKGRFIPYQNNMQNFLYFVHFRQLMNKQTKEISPK